MAYPANKNRTCKRYKHVPSVYGGTVRRCATYGGRRRRRGGYRKGKPPFNKGRTCKRFKRVYSSFFGKFVQRCARFKNGASKPSSAPSQSIYGGFAPGVPQLMTRPSAVAVETPMYGGFAPGVPATAMGIEMPSYARPAASQTPIYEARQMPLPGTRKRASRAPQQPTLPFQQGLPERMAEPPPPPERPRAPRRRLTEHERLMRAVRKSPGRVMDGLPL